MRFFPLVLAAALAVLPLAGPVHAEEHPAGLHIHDPYARAIGGIGKSGAVFFMMHNNTEVDDRLIDVRSDVAEKVELHTHKEDANGVMQMLHLTEGLPLAAGEMHALERGGDHVMLMGLTRALSDGDRFDLTLVFEQSGEQVVSVVLDNQRSPAAQGEPMMDHGDGHAHGHGHGG